HQLSHVPARLPDGDDGSGRGKNSIGLAWHNQSLELREKTDYMYVGCRKGIGEQLRGLVAEKHEIREAFGFDTALQYFVFRAAPAHQERDVRITLQQASRAEQRLELVSAAEVAGVAHDKLALQAQVLASMAVLRGHGHDPGGVGPVRNDLQTP